MKSGSENQTQSNIMFQICIRWWPIVLRNLSIYTLATTVLTPVWVYCFQKSLCSHKHCRSVLKHVPDPLVSKTSFFIFWMALHPSLRLQRSVLFDAFLPSFFFLLLTLCIPPQIKAGRPTRSLEYGGARAQRHSDTEFHSTRRSDEKRRRAGARKRL